MEIILVLLVVALLALGLLLYLQFRKTNAGPLDLVSLIQTNHQLMGDKVQQQERMLRETLQKQEHAATASIGRLNERLAVINSARKIFRTLPTKLEPCKTFWTTNKLAACSENFS